QPGQALRRGTDRRATELPAVTLRALARTRRRSRISFRRAGRLLADDATSTGTYGLPCGLFLLRWNKSCKRDVSRRHSSCPRVLRSPATISRETELNDCGSPRVTFIGRGDRYPILDLRELWEYRDLLYLLACRDVQARYRHTVVGAAWALLQPLLSM